MSLIAVEIIFRSTEIYPRRKISPHMHHKAQEWDAKVKKYKANKRRFLIMALFFTKKKTNPCHVSLE